MEQNKYVLGVRVTSLVVAVIDFILCLICVINYAVSIGVPLAAVILIPYLYICLFFTAVSLLLSFLNLSSRLGQIAFILNLLCVLFIVLSFVFLYMA